jgi:CheY-like chemotaxis protein
MAVRARAIIATPNGAEGEQFADWLTTEGFDAVKAATPAGAVAALTARPFDLLLTDAGFAFRDGLDASARPHRRNPLTPTIVVGDTPSAQTQAEMRGAMYLGRPVERDTLMCSVTMAMMDERPVRRSPRKSVDRFEAVVDGMRSNIIDVSPEGLRLEISTDRRSSPPPFFSVRVPLIGTALIVQRMWAMRRSPAISWYGGALARNSSRAEQAWRDFVDAVPRNGRSSSFQIE